MSGIGKGVIAASIGKIIQVRGLKVTAVKIDPYLNYDAGTMNPYIHGEVFVTEDGGETDMDVGTYERFLDINVPKNHNITTGQVYFSVIERERKGDFLGKCVQIIPHITDEIKDRLRRIPKEEGVDLVLVEIGGTVGDIESLPYLEAARQLRLEEGGENVLNVHVTLVPVLDVVGEQKTKPTQHSVMKLREIGIQPDILICRTDRDVPSEMRDKIAMFCNVDPGSVFCSPDVKSIYELPLELHRQGLDDRLAELLNIWSRAPKLERWERIVEKTYHPTRGEVRIAIVGKYVELKESYKSLNEALLHGGIANDVKVALAFVDSQELEEQGPAKFLSNVDAILVPGGFGVRGTEGKIAAVKYAREQKIPFFGICLGMQMAVVEFARSKLHLPAANSLEFDEKTPDPVVTLMESQVQVQNKGGTMRLGTYRCVLKPGTLAQKLYAKDEVSERHRHRYEVNNQYRGRLQEAGLVFCGHNPELGLVEMIELGDHPHFIGCQFHPEFKSKPFAPHPLFSGLIRAAMELRDARHRSQPSVTNPV